MLTLPTGRTVFVVDDDPAAMGALVLLLESDGLTARGFASACDFLSQLDAQARGCVIADLRRPRMDGVQLIKTLRGSGCILPVIVLSAHADVTRVVDAMKAGATDFFEKPYESEQLLRAVRVGLEANDLAADAGDARARVQRRMESLTARERQVLDLIMAGSSNKVIAARLAISPRTVEIYRANVMSKMRADSLSDLIRTTITAGAA